MGTVLGITVVLLTPVALAYSWFFFFTQMWEKETGWRSRVTGLSLLLVTSAAVLWPLVMLAKPGANWATGVGVARQMEWVRSWTRGALVGLLVAVVMSLFGRPRLILPTCFACVGVALFWMFSIMP